MVHSTDLSTGDAALFVSLKRRRAPTEYFGHVFITIEITNVTVNVF